MTSDPWADVPLKITAHQVGQIITLIEDYTTTEAADLIHTLVVRQCTPAVCCSAEVGHSRTCPTQGRD